LLEGVTTLREQAFGGAALEVPEDSTGLLRVMTGQHDMHVVGHDGHGEQGVARCGRNLAQPQRGVLRLSAGERRGAVLEVLLGGAAIGGVVGAGGGGSTSHS